MKAKQVEVYLRPSLAEKLQERGLKPRTGVIQQLLERYFALCEYLSSRVRLSEEEWNYLRDALHGFMLFPENIPYVPHMLASAVIDSRFDGLDEKWGVDADALAEKVLRLHPAEALAVVDAVEVFWNSQGE